ncbi:unnamed protein product [Periconia digitata]|uniref:Uncharacterized protein n=1 Tax=Periconia digitata TaxID=1303443 RepID=A0A9W4UAK0_9PLEO|nr:unnamed protein product [Periconia digitata]
MYTASFFLIISALSPILAAPVTQDYPPEKQVKVILENPTSGKTSVAYLNARKDQEPASFTNQGPFTTIEVIPGRDVSGGYSACKVLDAAGNTMVAKHNGEAHTALTAGKKWSFDGPIQVASVKCSYALAYISGEYERRDVSEDPVPTVTVKLYKNDKAAASYKHTGENVSFSIVKEQYTEMDLTITGETDCKAQSDKGDILGIFRGGRSYGPEGGNTQEYHSIIPGGTVISQIVCAPGLARDVTGLGA